MKKQNLISRKNSLWGTTAWCQYSKRCIYPKRKEYFYTSGLVAPIKDENAPVGTTERYGDTYQQSLGTLERIKKRSQKRVSMEDVFFLRVYLAPDKDGNIDWNAWFKAYGEYFNVTKIQIKWQGLQLQYMHWPILTCWLNWSCSCEMKNIPLITSLLSFSLSSCDGEKVMKAMIWGFNKMVGEGYFSFPGDFDSWRIWGCKKS